MERTIAGIKEDMMDNDLISRSALVEDFRRIARAQANARVFEAADAWEGAADRIENAPAVDAEPVRHGRWEHGMRCTQCGQIDLSKPNYCPNCGARMDGDEHA